MESDPRPMDPERLAEIRAWSEKPDTPFNDRSWYRELLAHVEWQDLEIEQWRDDAKVSAVRALEHFDARTRLEAEVARLRARVRVEAGDVELAGVTLTHVHAWERANGQQPSKRADEHALARGRGHGLLAQFVRDNARKSGRPGLDILDEMAAMPMTDKHTKLTAADLDAMKIGSVIYVGPILRMAVMRKKTRRGWQEFNPISGRAYGFPMSSAIAAEEGAWP